MTLMTLKLFDPPVRVIIQGNIVLVSPTFHNYCFGINMSCPRIALEIFGLFAVILSPKWSVSFISFTVRCSDAAVVTGFE